ncbi:hypothetical protein GGU11DRAFT_757882, partial [Lentinula aff. detonsa]
VLSSELYIILRAQFDTSDPNHLLDYAANPHGNLNSNRILHAVWSDDSRTQLQPKEVKEDDELFYHLRCNWVTLGKAKFGSSADKNQALEALLSITMPLHKATGGKCWDYIELALETMNKRKELVDFASILATFKVVQEKFRTRS